MTYFSVGSVKHLVTLFAVRWSMEPYCSTIRRVVGNAAASRWPAQFCRTVSPAWPDYFRTRVVVISRQLSAEYRTRRCRLTASHRWNDRSTVRYHPIVVTCCLAMCATRPTLANKPSESWSVATDSTRGPVNESGFRAVCFGLLFVVFSRYFTMCVFSGF